MKGIFKVINDHELYRSFWILMFTWSLKNDVSEFRKNMELWKSKNYKQLRKYNWGNNSIFDMFEVQYIFGFIPKPYTQLQPRKMSRIMVSSSSCSKWWSQSTEPYLCSSLWHNCTVVSKISITITCAGGVVLQTSGGPI